MKKTYTKVFILIILIYCTSLASEGYKENEEDLSETPSYLPEPGAAIYGRMRVGIDINYFESGETYDKEGTATENYGMDKFSRWNQNMKFSYRVVDDTEALNSNWKIKVGATASFLQETWTPGDESSGGSEYSGSGWALNLGGGAYTKNFLKSDTRFGLWLKYQYDGTGEPDQDSFAATDRQDALGIKVKSYFNFSPSIKGYAGGSYWNTFSRTESGYDYQTGTEKDVKVDDGNYYSLFGGLAYDWDLDCGDLYIGLGLGYWGRSSQCYDDNEIEDSDANSLSLIPKVGFRLKSTPLSFYLSGSAKNEYGIQQGIIDLSGKNTAKSSTAIDLGARFRF